MKKWVFGIMLILLLSGCRRYPLPAGDGKAPPVQDEEGNQGSLAKGREGGQALPSGGREENRDFSAQGREGGQDLPSQGEGKNQEPLAQEGEGSQALAAGGEAFAGQDGQILSGETAAPKKERIPVKVRGIYLSAYMAGSSQAMEKVLGQLKDTELNAVVIDVKDDEGHVTFQMDSPIVQEVGSCVNYISDIGSLLGALKEQGVYCIARIPAFRDPFLANAKPEWCLKKADGSIYRDRNNLAWVNPYKKEVWEYLLEIAEEAGRAGFDEIQFDYIRFCTEKGMDQVVFQEEDTEGKSRQEIILEFTDFAYGRLKDRGLFVSADVFGAVIHSSQDGQAVGQDYREMAKRLDYICPMVYPSHYGNGNFGIPCPDTQPYETVYHALLDSVKVLSSPAGSSQGEEAAKGDSQGLMGTDGIRGTVRPWLQDFTASYLPRYIPYGPTQVREQIQAVYDAGYEEWILWSAAGNYHYGGLLPLEEAQKEEQARAGIEEGTKEEE